MTSDAVAQIIKTIQSKLSSSQTSALQSNTTLLGQVDSVVGIAANYAQLLSTAGPVVSPLAQQAAASIVSAVATAAGDSATEAKAAAEAASAAVVGTAATAIGAGIVLIVSVILGVLGASEQSGTSDAQLLSQLIAITQDIENAALASYWQQKITTIMTFWDSPTGGLGTDLDNLANQGLGGNVVKQDVSGFHDHALGFVNLFIPARSPGAEIFWERPVVQEQLFVTNTWSWYTNNWPVSKNPPSPYPQPQPAPPLGGSDEQMVADPRSMLPYLLLGISCYLKLQCLVNFISPDQPTFSQFLSQFQADLQAYISFIQSQYSLAANAITKRGIPNNESLLKSIFYYINPDPTNDDPEIWNGYFGVVDAYPPYGVYQPPPPVSLAVSTNAPSYLLEAVTNNNVAPFVSANSSNATNEQSMAAGWTVPWLQNKLLLRMMAQWKAIYLLNGYDKVWSTLQKLSNLVNQSLSPLKLQQDGTIASGNWSTRELCTMINVSGEILNGVQNSSLGAPLVFPFNYPPSKPIPVMDGGGYGPFPGQYSLFALVQCLDNIATGTWVPPKYPAGHGPSRPLGFRERLAVAAGSNNL